MSSPGCIVPVEIREVLVRAKIADGEEIRVAAGEGGLLINGELVESKAA